MIPEIQHAPQFSQENLAFVTLGDTRHPAIVFLHGFMGAGRDWMPLARQFSGNYFCILPDIPGHGNSTGMPQQAFAMPACAASIISLLDELQTPVAHLIGYSMGGRLAFYLACHFGERCDHLILESASPGLRTAAERRARIEHDEQLAQKLEIGDLRDFLDFWFELPLFANLQKHKLLDILKKSRLRNDPHQLALSLRKMGTGSMPNLWPLLQRIKNPVLLLTGGLDEKFCRINSAAVRQLAHGYHKIFPGCGHNMHFEAEALFLQTIKDFIINGGNDAAV